MAHNVTLVAIHYLKIIEQANLMILNLKINFLLIGACM